jgi:dodecin
MDLVDESVVSTTNNRSIMTDHVYSVSEIVGSSPDSIEDAINGALARARKTLRNLNWFEVTELRGYLTSEGAVDHYQVALKLGFRMED